MRSSMRNAGARSGTTDGRVLRAERSRDQITTALYELVGEGNPEPTAQQVSERAGVGIRTVFRLFSDMDALYATIQPRIMDDVLPMLGEVPSASEELAERVRKLAADRAALFERIAPYMRATILVRGRSAFLEEHYRDVVHQLRARLLLRLPELRHVSAETLEAVDQVTSFEAWDRLRRTQRLARPRARAVMEHTVRALIDTALRS